MQYGQPYPMKKSTTIVPCQPNAPCPNHVTIVNKQIEPAAQGEPTTDNDHGHKSGHHSEQVKPNKHDR